MYLKMKVLFITIVLLTLSYRANTNSSGFSTCAFTGSLVAHGTAGAAGPVTISAPATYSPGQELTIGLDGTFKGCHIEVQNSGGTVVGTWNVTTSPSFKQSTQTGCAGAGVLSHKNGIDKTLASFSSTTWTAPASDSGTLTIKAVAVISYSAGVEVSSVTMSINPLCTINANCSGAVAPCQLNVCNAGACEIQNAPSDGKNGTGECICIGNWNSTLFCDECNDGFFGSDCSGECLNCVNGQCKDGKNGTGECICIGNWNNTLFCDECNDGFFGSNCSNICPNCVNGYCSNGKNGTGECLCEQCWKGEDCSVKDINCNFFWEFPAEWSDCSVVCGRGKKNKTEKCFVIDTNDNNNNKEQLNDESCFHLGSPKTDEKSCGTEHDFSTCPGIICSAGAFCPFSNETEILCPTNYYNPDLNGSCKPCPFGSYCKVEGCIFCTECADVPDCSYCMNNCGDDDDVIILIGVIAAVVLLLLIPSCILKTYEINILQGDENIKWGCFNAVAVAFWLQWATSFIHTGDFGTDILFVVFLFQQNEIQYSILGAVGALLLLCLIYYNFMYGFYNYQKKYQKVLSKLKSKQKVKKKDKENQEKEHKEQEKEEDTLREKLKEQIDKTDKLKNNQLHASDRIIKSRKEANIEELETDSDFCNYLTKLFEEPNKVIIWDNIEKEIADKGDELDKRRKQLKEEEGKNEKEFKENAASRKRAKNEVEGEIQKLQNRVNNIKWINLHNDCSRISFYTLIYLTHPVILLLFTLPSRKQGLFRAPWRKMDWRSREYSEYELEIKEFSYISSVYEGLPQLIIQIIVIILLKDLGPIQIASLIFTAVSLLSSFFSYLFYKDNDHSLETSYLKYEEENLFGNLKEVQESLVQNSGVELIPLKQKNSTAEKSGKMGLPSQNSINLEEFIEAGRSIGSRQRFSESEEVKINSSPNQKSSENDLRAVRDKDISEFNDEKEPRTEV